MKYIIIVLVALLVCFLIGYLIAHIFKKKMNKRVHLKMFFLTLVIGLVLLAITSFVYLNIYYHAGEKAQSAMEGNDSVKVEKTDGGYFFDGPGQDKAIIFYQGAKVEAKAYAPLMLKLSESGYDCFLADMPFNFAILGGNIADKFISSYDYETWVMSGHSMGGIMAASYANNHKDVVDDIVLLASYTTDKIEDIGLCSIYGSKDGCLQKDVYEDKKANWPQCAREFVIDGGNHAQFGDYGKQKGDNNAEITDDEQQDKTVEAIRMFLDPIEIDPQKEIYSDDNCTISYCTFTPIDDAEKSVKLLVNNKTEDTLTIQCKSVTLDGVTYNNVVVSENVYPNSDNVIELKVEDCKNLNPETFSAEIEYMKNYYYTSSGKDPEKITAVIKETSIK